MIWPKNPTKRDLLVHREDMFDPVVTGVGIADAGYVDATPVDETDGEDVTASSGYNDIDPTVDEVRFDAVPRDEVEQLPGE